MPLQISQPFLTNKNFLHESTGICSTSRPGITNARICHLYSCVLSGSPITEEYYPYHGRKWFLTWLSSAQVSTGPGRLRTSARKGSSWLSRCASCRTRGPRGTRPPWRGFRRPRTASWRSAWFRPATLPWRSYCHTMTGTLRLCAIMLRIKKEGFTV